MKYTIKTTYPCVIKTENDCFELNQNDSLECEDEKVLFVYPQTKFVCPFCIDLLSKSDSELFSFLRHNDKNYILIEKPKIFFVEKKESLIIGGKNIKVFVGNSHIIFEGQNHRIKCRVSHKTDNYKISHSQKFVFVEFQNDFYAFNVSTEKVSHFSGENLSFEKNVLSITRKYDDFSCRKKRFSVKFDEMISVEEENYSSDSRFDKKLVPVLFMEALQSKDFACAINFLSSELQKKIKKENLSQFFGEIEYVLPLNLNEFLVLSKTAKSYASFDVKEEKICDISLDEL